MTISIGTPQSSFFPEPTEAETTWLHTKSEPDRVVGGAGSAHYDTALGTATTFSGRPGLRLGSVSAVCTPAPNARSWLSAMNQQRHDNRDLMRARRRARIKLCRTALSSEASGSP